MLDQTIKEFEEKLGLPLRGFKWIGKIQKPHKQHFVEFYSWDGEIYSQGKILTLKEYYKSIIQKEYCLYVNGVMLAINWYSQHYNSLYRTYIKRYNQIKEEDKVSAFPLIDSDNKMVFESSVALYKNGVFTEEQLKIRIERYIQPNYRKQVFESILNEQTKNRAV